MSKKREELEAIAKSLYEWSKKYGEDYAVVSMINMKDDGYCAYNANTTPRSKDFEECNIHQRIYRLKIGVK